MTIGVRSSPFFSSMIWSLSSSMRRSLDSRRPAETVPQQLDLLERRLVVDAVDEYERVAGADR